MKKFIITAFIAVALTTSAFADPTNVSYRVLDHFNTDFREAENISWTLSSKFAKANFDLNGKRMEAFYNLDGELIGSSFSIDYDKLPKKAITEISKKYPFPPYKLKECIEFTNGEGEKSYYTSFDTEKELVVVQINLFGNLNEIRKILK
jgi:hypothetical protein